MKNQKKSGFITIIGRPNVGKSTLLNQILGEKMVITSHKPQTTRNAIRCIYNDPETQMVFIDTPGIIPAKNKLGDYMNKSVSNALKDVEAVVFIVEPDEKFGKGDQAILKMLEKIKTPKIAVINKIDTVEKEKLLQVIKNLSDYNIFDEIIPISALKGEGVEILINNLKEKLPEGPSYFPEDMIIDQSERFILAELIREKLLRFIKEEIPHGTAVEITKMKMREDKDLIDIEATIFCERKSHKRIIIGKNGSMIKKIGSMARADMERFLKQPVNLQLWVKVRDNWREKPFDLKDLGYSITDGA